MAQGNYILRLPYLQLVMPRASGSRTKKHLRPGRGFVILSQLASNNHNSSPATEGKHTPFRSSETGIWVDDFTVQPPNGQKPLHGRSSSASDSLKTLE